MCVCVCVCVCVRVCFCWVPATPKHAWTDRRIMRTRMTCSLSGVVKNKKKRTRTRNKKQETRNKKEDKMMTTTNKKRDFETTFASLAGQLTNCLSLHGRPSRHSERRNVRGHVGICFVPNRPTSKHRLFDSFSRTQSHPA